MDPRFQQVHPTLQHDDPAYIPYFWEQNLLETVQMEHLQIGVKDILAGANVLLQDTVYWKTN